MVYASFGKKTPFTHPYSYDPFVLFKAAGDPRGTIYTDRLWQQDHAKHDMLLKKHFGDVGQYWDRRPIKGIESFLQDWTGDAELKLILLEQHCNLATGFPVWRIDYT